MLDVEALYRKYGPMVLRRCRSILKDEEKARDAMQDTFVRVLRGKERLSEDAPSSLLYCIATNVCLNVLRAERSRPASAGDGMLEAIAGCDDVEGEAQAKALAEGILEAEEPSTRTMAVLHYVDGLTLEETASRVGLSVSGLRKRLDAFKRRSKRYIGEAE